MPLPVIAAGGLWAIIIVPLVVKVFLALGVGFITYTGVDLLLDEAYDLIVNQVQALPPEPLQMIGMMNFDKYITILFSAYSAKLVISGLTSAGTLSKINFKGVTT